MQPKLKFWLLCLVGWLLALIIGLSLGVLENETLSTEPSRVVNTQASIPTTTTSTTSTTTTTTTTTTVALVKKRKKGKCPKYEQVFARYGLEPVEVFSYIAWRESRCTPDAMNTTLNRDGSFDSGLLQINSTWKTVTRNICGGGLELLVNLDCNLRVAKYLLDNGGLGHWGINDAQG